MTIIPKYIKNFILILLFLTKSILIYTIDLLFEECKTLQKNFIESLDNQSNRKFSDKEYKSLGECIKKKKTNLQNNTKQETKYLIQKIVETNNKPALEFLIKTQYNLNIPDEKGNTPIFYAYNSPEIIKILAEQKANLHHKNNEGKTPFNYYMTYHPNHSAIKTLIDFQVDLKSTDNNQLNGIQNALKKDPLGSKEAITITLNSYQNYADFSKEERQQLKALLAQDINFQKTFTMLCIVFITSSIMQLYVFIYPM